MSGVGCCYGFDFHHETRVELIQCNLGKSIIGEAMMDLRDGERQDVGQKSVFKEGNECTFDLIRCVDITRINFNKPRASNACAPAGDLRRGEALNNIGYDTAVDDVKYHSCSKFIVLGIPMEVNGFFNLVVVGARGEDYLYDDTCGDAKAINCQTVIVDIGQDDILIYICWCLKSAE